MCLRLLIFSIMLIIIFKLCESLCDLHDKYGDCIRDPQQCYWCSTDRLNVYDKRCKARKTVNENLCDRNFVEDSQSKEPAPRRNNNYKEDIQVRPQEYDITIRVGESVKFNFTYKPAKDYPADIYFLIDASISINASKLAIANASEQIYKNMIDNTNNVFLGLGTFIDKNALPYVSKENPSVYSFKHQLGLSNGFEIFKDFVTNVSLGDNYDDPKGGLDALAQVIACKEEIEWRNVSRKIIVYVTDNLYHSAGDGKWAGITQPYDGRCYTKNKIYTKELEMDYPSIGVINKLVENDIIEITSTMKLKTNITTVDQEFLKLMFQPNFTKKSSHDCKVILEQEKNIYGVIEIKQYPKRANIPIDIMIDGVNERLRVNIHVITNCDCENDTRILINDKYYDGHGNKVCGICKCNENRYGDKCQCTSNDINRDKQTCKRTNNSLPCSGHGECFCVSCRNTCYPGFGGDFCECSKNDCPNNCNGRSECLCGKCLQCEKGWTGSTCDCSMEPCEYVNGTMCSSCGKCECALCVCDLPSPWDARYEQHPNCTMKPCTSCHYRQCSLLTACALCYHNERKRENCHEQCDTRFSFVDNTFNISMETCDKVRVGIGCYTSFKYRYTKPYGVELLVKRDSDCVESYYKFGGVLAGTLLATGILTLIGWKLLTDARDRQEYEKFVREYSLDQSAPCYNPVYEPATTTFRNPAFRRRSSVNL